MASVCDNSKKILHRYCFVRIPSPHVTLHGDQCVSLINLQKKFKWRKKRIKLTIIDDKLSRMENCGRTDINVVCMKYFNDGLWLFRKPDENYLHEMDPRPPKKYIDRKLPSIIEIYCTLHGT